MMNRLCEKIPFGGGDVLLAEYVAYMDFELFKPNKGCSAWSALWHLETLALCIVILKQAGSLFSIFRYAHVLRIVNRALCTFCF